MNKVSKFVVIFGFGMFFGMLGFIVCMLLFEQVYVKFFEGCFGILVLVLVVLLKFVFDFIGYVQVEFIVSEMGKLMQIIVKFMIDDVFVKFVVDVVFQWMFVLVLENGVLVVKKVVFFVLFKMVDSFFVSY